MHKYQWEHRNITVTFNESLHGGSGHQQGHSSSQANGETPRNLEDLVGERASWASQELEKRGYEFANSDAGGPGSSFTNWWERSSGRCISVKTTDGRYETIRYAMEATCSR
ncbi:MAG: hypothetical protein P8Y52_06010 [Xanthomonadales bacterium]|jgi:hypothetical protein